MAQGNFSDILDWMRGVVSGCEYSRCRGNLRGCIEMGQDHGGLEPRNRGCEGRGFVIYVCLETLVRKRSLAKVREGESVRGFVCKHGRRQRHHEQLMLGR